MYQILFVCFKNKGSAGQVRYSREREKEIKSTNHWCLTNSNTTQTTAGKSLVGSMTQINCLFYVNLLEKRQRSLKPCRLDSCFLGVFALGANKIKKKTASPVYCVIC